MITEPPAATGAPPGGPHLDDAALLRWLDSEPDVPNAIGAEAAAPAAEHAAACALCAARANLLRTRRARLTALLLATDEPLPSTPDSAAVLRLAEVRRAEVRRAEVRRAEVRRAEVRRAEVRRAAATPARPARMPWAPARPAWRARPGVRLAAAGVALAAASLAAQPVRQWVATQWARLTAGPAAPTTPGATPAPAARSAAPAVQPLTMVVTFTPEPGPFTVRFDARPAAGTLRIVAEPGGRASAAVTGGDGATDLVVLPAGLRVRNRPTSASSYRLTVPAATGRVRLLFGAPAADTVIDLAGRREVVVPLGARPRTEPDGGRP